MVSCVKDFYRPPLPKTLAGVVFKRRQCKQVMERLESAFTKSFLTNAEMVYHFRRAFWCCLGGGGEYLDVIPEWPEPQCSHHYACACCRVGSSGYTLSLA